MQVLRQSYVYGFLQMQDAIARKAGLSGTDHRYLTVLMQEGEMTAGRLSDLTGLTTGAVTGLVDRLEKKKLVKRQFAKSDRRKVIIEPNIKNINALLAPFKKDFERKLTRISSALSMKEIRTIENYFFESIKIMNEMRS